MGEGSTIAWTDDTYNPWIGCSKVSPGCANCYAERQTFPRIQRESGRELWGPDAERHRTSVSYRNDPFRWDRAAAKEGKPRFVFCGSLCDVFEDRRDLDAWRMDLWSIVRTTTHLTWLLLTKRADVLDRLAPDPWPENAWLGVTVENQDAVWRLGKALDVPGVPLVFASVEPMLGPVNLGIVPCPACNSTENVVAWPCPHCRGRRFRGPGWVIVGGESGKSARPMHDAWVRDVKNQCLVARVPFFYKQRIVDGRKIEMPVLDGVVWAQRPEVRT